MIPPEHGALMCTASCFVICTTAARVPATALAYVSRSKWPCASSELRHEITNTVLALGDEMLDQAAPGAMSTL